MTIRKWAPWVVVPALVALVAALLISIAAVGGSAPSGSGGADDALRRDATSYAADFGVSETEALRRLRLQDEIGALDVSLASGETDTFGGLWIEHGTDFVVKAGFTHDGAAALSRHGKSDDLATSLQAVSVAATYETLLTQQETAAQTVSSVGVSANLDINVSGSLVEVYVLDADKLNDALADAGVTLPSRAVVVEVESLTTPLHGYEIHGGEHLTSCTSGFSVENDDGDEGISTAGHCQDYQLRGSTFLTPVSGGKWYGGSYDVRWYTADSAFTMRNLVYDGTNHRYIYSGRHRNNQSVGQYVCKYGKTTGNTCGSILTKNFKPGLVFSNTWIKVDGGDDDDFVAKGDSGGPWFIGNVAYGITHGRQGNDAIYMAINYIEDLDLSLITESE